MRSLTEKQNPSKNKQLEITELKNRETEEFNRVFQKWTRSILPPQASILTHVTAAKYHFLQQDTTYHPTKVALPLAYPAFYITVFIFIAFVTTRYFFGCFTRLFCFPTLFFYSLFSVSPTESFKRVCLFCFCPVSPLMPGTQKVLSEYLWSNECKGETFLLSIYHVTGIVLSAFKYIVSLDSQVGRRQY